MFGAIARLFRSIGYLFTGKVDAARKDLSRDPHVIQATFDKIVREKAARINQYKDAVARMITQEETKLQQVKRLSDEVAQLEQLKEGAAAKAKSVADRMKGDGKSTEQIKADEDYRRCLAAFNDFTSTAAEKRGHIDDLERDLKEITDSVAGHKIQLQQLLRDLEKVKGEASATVADVITAREEEEINGMIAGISQDRTSRELQEMRELRSEGKAKARVARELAGTDTARQESEFLDYARKGVATDEFDQLIGLADEKDTATATREVPADVRLPE